MGTNLIESLLNKGHEVINIDLQEPKIPGRRTIWKNIDITARARFEEVTIVFNPDYIVHLAARTDLNGKTLADYAANIEGVENLMRIIHKLPNLRKAIITSSKFVTRNGYQVRHQHDYCPHTKYGESKVETELRVWSDKPHCDWCIIRPTSIWGPWFGVPYRDFFDLIIRRMYFRIGRVKCHKTYGYIGNAIYQIESLLFSDTQDENNKVFYIGDAPPYEINEWANEIAHELGYKVPTIPFFLVKMLARFGDFLALFGIAFPMQSFRLNNMTNDGINDMSSTYQFAPETPYTRIDGVRATLAWLKVQDSGTNRHS